VGFRCHGRRRQHHHDKRGALIFRAGVARPLEIDDYIESDPEPVWEFARKWGANADADLRMAIATCILEHLLEYHFQLNFPRVEVAVGESPAFADCFASCWPHGQAQLPVNHRVRSALIW